MANGLDLSEPALLNLEHGTVVPDESKDLVGFAEHGVKMRAIIAKFLARVRPRSVVALDGGRFYAVFRKTIADRLAIAVSRIVRHGLEVRGQHHAQKSPNMMSVGGV